MSNALARLRDALGDPLLVRAGRGLVPTPRALQLAPAVSRALAELQRGLDDGSFDAQTTTRELTIALTDADQLATLPKIARRFVEVMPAARLRAVSIDTLLATGGLSGEVDLALGIGEYPGVRMQPLYEVAGVFVVARDHPRVKRRLTRRLFERERHVDVLVAGGRPGWGNKMVEDALARKGMQRQVAIAVPTFVAAVMVAAETELVAGVPRGVAESLNVPVKIVTPPFGQPNWVLNMMWHERTEHDPAAKCLREIVASVFC
ncbi:MAG: LysR family transcriptional regulator [Myxococcales bacterium]|nr:LysR family transcriptional regulator [Myxococcales bacterium]